MVAIPIIVLTAITLAGMWKVFTKAGQPGWTCLVPILNLYILLVVANKPKLWLLLLLFVPIANVIVYVLTWLAVAKQFGRGVGFAIGLMLLPVVFVPILGFGHDRFVGTIAIPPSPPPRPDNPLDHVGLT